MPHTCEWFALNGARAMAVTMTVLFAGVGTYDVTAAWQVVCDYPPGS